MQQDLIANVLAELERQMRKPSCDEIVVTQARLMERAKWMMEKRGYEHTMQSLQVLEAYMRGYSIWLEGPVGVGKTFFFEAVGDDMVFFSPLKHMALRLEAIEEEVRDSMYKDMVIEDVGAEPVYNNFGSKIDLLPWLIEKRLESPCRTHVTTNMAPTVIDGRYGARVIDRIGGMCKKFRMEGVSRRMARTNRRYVDIIRKFTVKQ